MVPARAFRSLGLAPGHPAQHRMSLTIDAIADKLDAAGFKVLRQPCPVVDCVMLMKTQS